MADHETEVQTARRAKLGNPIRCDVLPKRVTRSELEDRKLEAQQMLGAAKRRAVDDPSAAVDIAQCRAALQFIEDQIEGLIDREREEADAEVAKAKAKDEKERRKAVTAGLIIADEVDAAASAVIDIRDLLVEACGTLRAKESALYSQCNRAVPSALTAPEHVALMSPVRDQLSTTFRPTSQLIGAEIARCFNIPETTDRFELDKIPGLVGMTTSRTAWVRQWLYERLATEDDAQDESHD